MPIRIHPGCLLTRDSKNDRQDFPRCVTEMPDSPFERLPQRCKLIAGLIVLIPVVMWFTFLEATVPKGTEMRYCPKREREHAVRENRVILCQGRPVIYELGYGGALLIGMGIGQLYVLRASRTRRRTD